MTVSKSTAPEQHDRANRWLRIEHYIVVISVVILAYVLNANYQRHGPTLLDWDWLFISGFFTFIASVHIARSLSPKLETLLMRLSDRGVLVGSGDTGAVLCRDAEPIRALRRRMGELEHWATQITGGLVSLILLLACIKAFGQSGIQELLQHADLTVVATAAGYVAGRRIGQMIAYSCFGWLIGQAKIAIVVKPGHIDGAAGLKPVGTFYFFQAMLLAIPAVFLGTWWFLFPLWQAHDYTYWRDPYLGMLFVAIIFEVAAFLTPMWRFHTIMRDQMDVLVARADDLSTRIEELQGEQGRVLEEQTAGQIRERLAAMQREYWDIENMPTWPVDLATWRRFARNNLLLVLPLLTKLLGAETVAGRILGTLDDVLKKQTG